MDCITRSCKVCNEKTTGFNYGVQSCNACKMFFRRALDTPKVLKCGRDGNCPTIVLDSGESQCRFCRFHKCIIVGMIFLDAVDDPTNIINKLLVMDTKRRDIFLNCTIPESLTVDEVFSRRSFPFEPRKPGTVFNFCDWGVINHLSCISFIRQLDFIKFLSSQDTIAIFKYSHLMYLILVTAMRSYLCKEAAMNHPGKVDVFPEEAQYAAGYNKQLLNDIRCLLVGRLSEIKITHEEFILLSVIILCNPGATNLSKSGRIILASNQERFSSILLHYCLITNSKCGPARFNEILSLCHVVSRTLSDLDNLTCLYSLVHTVPAPPNLFNNILKFLLH